MEKNCPYVGKQIVKLGKGLSCEICGSVKHNTGACKMTKDVAPLQITLLTEPHEHLGLSVFVGRTVTVEEPIKIMMDENGKRTEVRDENQAERMDKWLGLVPGSSGGDLEDLS